MNKKQGKGKKIIVKIVADFAVIILMMIAVWVGASEKKHEMNRQKESYQKPQVTTERQRSEQEMKEYHISSPTVMAEIGEMTTAEVYNLDVERHFVEYVTITKLYTGEEATKIVKDYCKTPECPYEYEEPPEGTSWHVVEYTTDYNPMELYPDIRLFGLDEERLEYEGKSYTTRTHDIFSNFKKENGKFTNLYCYYAVPDGCNEYMLRIGDKMKGIPVILGYYHVKCEN